MSSACMCGMPEETVAEQAVNVVQSLLVLGVAGVAALALHLLVFRTLFRLGWKDRLGREIRDRCRWPSRWTVAVLAMLAALPATELSPGLTDKLQHGLTVTAIVTATWWLTRLLIAVEIATLAGLDIDPEGPYDGPARRKQTQVILLRRVGTALIVILASGAVLLTFDEARSLGTSLLASAGILGIVAGVAAQSTLGNVIAGIQIAVAEPIKIDDVVVVEGEWGNIEEISLTYVVVKIWDRRRLVLPTSYFVNTPFTNWSRNGTQIIGAVSWHLDHRTPVDALRQEFHRFVQDSELWDGDIASLQVIDTDPDTVHVRGIVTASDSTRLWNLRCDVREALLAWLRDTHPESLPATRILEAPAAPSRRRRKATSTRRPAPGPETDPAPDPDRADTIDGD